MTTIRIYNICPEWTICICNTVVNELYVILVADVYLYKCLIFNYEIFFPVNIFNLYRNIFIFQLFVGWLMSYLRYLCLFAHTGFQHILCCVFLCLVYPMLSVSLGFPFLIAFSVFSNVYLLFCFKKWKQRCIMKKKSLDINGQQFHQY